MQSVTLDGRQVSEIDSSGLSLLLTIHRHQETKHGTFQLVADSPQITRALEVTKLDSVIAVRRQLPDQWAGDPPPRESTRWPRRKPAVVKPPESG